MKAQTCATCFSSRIVSAEIVYNLSIRLNIAVLGLERGRQVHRFYVHHAWYCAYWEVMSTQSNFKVALYYVLKYFELTALDLDL